MQVFHHRLHEAGGDLPLHHGAAGARRHGDRSPRGVHRRAALHRAGGDPAVRGGAAAPEDPGD